MRFSLSRLEPSWGFSGVPAARAVPTIVPLGIAVGAAASALAGELEVSLAFLVFDTLQVTVSALLAYALGVAVAHRSGPQQLVVSIADGRLRGERVGGVYLVGWWSPP
jgi:hypothetical protein